MLVPTELEHRRLRAGDGGLAPGASIELCGFGPVAAAAVTAERLCVLSPGRVILVGIAGTFDSTRHPVGSAMSFSRVAIDGVGAGEGEGFVGPRPLNLPQWTMSGAGGDAPIHDELPLAVPPGGREAQLLTVCAASDSPAMADARRSRHPAAVAEDMEGFAVALACARANVPLTILRGISNVVGERDPAAWKITPALVAVRALLHRVLGRDEGSATP